MERMGTIKLSASSQKSNFVGCGRETKLVPWGRVIDELRNSERPDFAPSDEDLGKIEEWNPAHVVVGYGKTIRGGVPWRRRERADVQSNVKN